MNASGRIAPTVFNSVSVADLIAGTQSQKWLDRPEGALYDKAARRAVLHCVRTFKVPALIILNVRSQAHNPCKVWCRKEKLAAHHGCLSASRSSAVVQSGSRENRQNQTGTIALLDTAG